MRNYNNFTTRITPETDCDDNAAIFGGSDGASGARIFSEAREENDDCVDGSGGSGSGGGGGGGSAGDFGCAGGYYCSTPSAYNYNELYDVDEEGGNTCVDNSLCEFAYIDDGSVVVDTGSDPMYGCTDIAALNYSAQAEYDDGSCEYAPVEEDPFDEEPEPQIYGCTNPAALNYDPNATIGSDTLCEFEQAELVGSLNTTTIFVAGAAAILLLFALRKKK